MPDLALEVQEVTVSFGGLRALDAVSISVPQGSVVGLVGPNGAGKTTLLNAISGLQAVDSGRILLGGRDVTALPAHRRARLGIGRSFQDLGLMLDQTVQANLLAAQHLAAGYGPLDPLLRPGRHDRSERRLERRAREVSAEIGLDARWTSRVEDLPFGVARMVELAGIVAGDPGLLLLDEPTTGLDSSEAELLAELLRRLRSSGHTLLVVTHDVRFIVGLCDRTYVLAEGRLLYAGTPQGLARDERVVHSYLGAPNREPAP